MLKCLDIGSKNLNLAARALLAARIGASTERAARNLLNGLENLHLLENHSASVFTGRFALFNTTADELGRIDLLNTARRFGHSTTA